MSSTVFEFPLTEFQTVRVRCVHCGMVFPVGLERLGQLLPEGHCPQCQTQVANWNDLAALAQALRCRGRRGVYPGNRPAPAGQFAERASS